MARREVTERDNGRSYPAAPGDQIVVRLDETPSSGYRWRLDGVDERVLVPAGDGFRSEAGGLGAGGRRQLRFDAVGPGRTILRLSLRRGWPPDERPVRRFEVTITVR